MTNIKVKESVSKKTVLKNKATSFLKDPNKRLLLVVVLLVGGFSLYAVNINNDNNALQKQLEMLSGEQAADSSLEGRELKQEVSQFFELPTDEIPTVATVVDAEKVRNQPFFKNAQNGDKVLIFATTGKALLYRPDTKKIIEVAPINLGQSQSTQAKDGAE